MPRESLFQINAGCHLRVALIGSRHIMPNRVAASRSS